MTLIGSDGDDYLIRLDPPDLIRLGRDVVGEWADDGWLWLSSPHTANRIGLNEDSTIILPGTVWAFPQGGIDVEAWVPQLPVITLLLDQPRGTRLRLAGAARYREKETR